MRAFFTAQAVDLPARAQDGFAQRTTHPDPQESIEKNEGTACSARGCGQPLVLEPREWRPGLDWKRGANLERPAMDHEVPNGDKRVAAIVTFSNVCNAMGRRREKLAYGSGNPCAGFLHERLGGDAA